MSAHTTGAWQEIMSQLARDWGTAEVELLSEAMTDLHAKYNKKRKLLVGRTAMVVDDSVMMRLMMEEWLARAGINVSARAENGYEAVKIFNGDEHFDYVFLNVTMPELDGIEALTDLKKDRGSKIIMVTSTRLPVLVLESVKNGAHNVLYRPFDYGALLSVMCSETYFTPDAYDTVAERLAEMGKGSGELTDQMTQKEVFELAALATANRTNK
ncbi:MAG: response regulator [Defluviitaleaceae bacterium]|nr:response regulator [Defluviitaleaceae bacterium]MCL2836444.1 response regulator [Defluviitaleaceae bacterium]